MFRPFLILLVALCAVPAHAIPEPPTGRSGLPVPRMASLRSGEANARAGPGGQFPVTWVYRRKGLPIEVLREWGPWRLVRDPDGATGWMDGAMVAAVRTGLVTRAVRDLRERPDVAARPVFRVAPGVVGRVLMCAGPWCRFSVEGRAGWIPRGELWGVYAAEAIG